MHDTIIYPDLDKVLIPVPLPRLAWCANCKAEIRVRGNGRMYKHEPSFDSDAVYTHYVNDHGQPAFACPISGSEVVGLLEPTFARWLWMQSKRRDDYTNRLTQFAAFQFRGCTRAPKRTARDMSWATPEELHDELHQQQMKRTGSEMLVPAHDGVPGARCDWMCRDLETAAGIYRQLRADGQNTKEKP